MKELARLKEWHTPLEAARYLSKKLSDDISAADLLWYAIKGDLKLSFSFVDPSPAIMGIIETTDEGQVLGFPMWHGAIRWFWLPHRESAKRPMVPNNPARQPPAEIDWIDGVWDVLMIEDAPRAIEKIRHKLIDGAKVRKKIMDGIIFISADGKFARLEEQVNEPKDLSNDRHNFRLTRDLPIEAGTLVIRDTELVEFEARLRGLLRSEPPSAESTSKASERPPLDAAEGTGTEQPPLTSPETDTDYTASPFFRRGDFPDDEWKKEAWRIADEVALEQSLLGIQQITARSIADKVAERLNRNSNFHGVRGPRTANTVRSEALKGWKWRP